MTNQCCSVVSTNSGLASCLLIQQHHKTRQVKSCVRLFVFFEIGSRLTLRRAFLSSSTTKSCLITKHMKDYMHSFHGSPCVVPSYPAAPLRPHWQLQPPAAGHAPDDSSSSSSSSSGKIRHSIAGAGANHMCQKREQAAQPYTTTCNFIAMCKSNITQQQNSKQTTECQGQLQQRRPLSCCSHSRSTA
jgi:hypothetical protein